MLVCSDCTREQAKLTGELAVSYDNVIGCGFSQLAALTTETQDNVLVISWARADAELRMLADHADSQRWPLVVLLRQLEHQDIDRLPAPNGYVLLPADSATALSVWVARACQVRDSQSQMESALATLNRRLEDRRLVEQAKGLLMKHQGLDEAQAYRLLREAAMHNSQSLGQIAKNLLLSLNRM
ncbi:hypothetical protein KY46_15955 [Photobacterium halotolerans]|uniref:ANTAR domain-containing protein n=1 Tax=Photobacterium halotolerans TaxID=265726 RepID=A0A0F5V9U9_9GAMM|nr:hypothetical protein KY46_15955 [Photobacterium halotolerans]